ncbi:MAG: hypothetical protein EBQ85_06245 [Proteobacteria bacterium]|nr:hypothetical protein [Pseudomonadota bacterium]
MVRAVLFLVLLITVLDGPRVFSADFDLEPVTLFKCWRALRRLNTKQTPVVPIKFQSIIDNSNFTFPIFTKMDATVLEKQGPGENKWGGLVYRGVHGAPTVFFWPLKSSKSNLETHHRAAIIEILSNELKAIEHYLANPKHEKLSLLLEMQANYKYLLSEFKNNSQLPEGISDRFFGFVVQTEKKDFASGARIKSIDFDLNLIGSGKNRVFFGLMDELGVMLESISKSISPKLRPTLFRVNHELLNSYLGPNALKAPAHSRIVALDEK